MLRNFPDSRKESCGSILHLRNTNVPFIAGNYNKIFTRLGEKGETAEKT
jgi:hypothetical protein